MTQNARPLRALPAKPLRGLVRVPGDKSISHRALIFGALARGVTTIHGLLESEDVIATANALGALGASVQKAENSAWHVTGTGSGGMLDPVNALDLGNSGTGVRLLMGLIAGQGLTAQFIGDASLQSRPMNRVLDPLRQMGAIVSAASDKMRLPLTIQGTVPAMPLDYRLPVPSAQVKSAILIAGLGAIGHTIVRESEPTRDHTERMLKHFGADIQIGNDGGERVISVSGNAPLEARDIHVPGDPSSAAFPVVAGLLVPGSSIVVENVMINPTRAGLYTSLRDMGANLKFENERNAGGETIVDIRAAFSHLTGVEVPAARAPSMIDEYPILAIAAARASGETVMRRLGELRVKECDRLAAMLAGLRANGIEAHVEGDDLFVTGGAERASCDVVVETHLDHRIAMSFLILGLASKRPVTVDDSRMIATSFPEFCDLMTQFGAEFEEV